MPNLRTSVGGRCRAIVRWRLCLRNGTRAGDSVDLSRDLSAVIIASNNRTKFCSCKILPAAPQSLRRFEAVVRAKAAELLLQSRLEIRASYSDRHVWSVIRSLCRGTAIPIQTRIYLSVVLATIAGPPGSCAARPFPYLLLRNGRIGRSMKHLKHLGTG